MMLVRMLAKVFSGTVLGLEGRLVEVEVDLVKKGFPSFKVVGLPDKAVQESRDRVRSALLNSGAEFPDFRLTVNLAPADLPKEGSAFDLPIALGIILASEQMGYSPDLEKSLLWGELSLKGEVRSVKGALPLTLWAKKHGFTQVFLPMEDALEASVVSGVSVFPVQSLQEVFGHFSGLERIQPVPFHQDFSDDSVVFDCDFSDIYGQEQAKRALMISAAGGHNLFMMGVPGAGKTLLAKALPSILPPLSREESLEVTQIFSVAGLKARGKCLIQSRPFRSPHHTISRIGLTGGGSFPRPGEVSLAHRGVLFLDELVEFPRHVIESLRQPMEDGQITISRASITLTFPARFMLVAAANPCPCGFYGEENSRCRCSPQEISRYQKRISGPILDRFDIFIKVPEVKKEILVSTMSSRPQVKEIIPSNKIRKRVMVARERQRLRFDSCPKVFSNAEMSSRQLQKYCSLSGETELFFSKMVRKFRLSARGCHKILRVSRTIADLENKDYLDTDVLSEAFCYRQKIWH